MGTIATYKPRGQPLTQFLIEAGALRWTNPEFRHTILDSAFVSLSEHYAAVEKVEVATGNREVWASVIKVQLFKKGRDGCNIAYKNMSEHCGPRQIRCPVRILDMLTETDSEYAKAWRTECRDRLAKLAAMPVLKPGIPLTFEYPLRFSNGLEASQFVIKQAQRAKIILANPAYPLSAVGWISRASFNRHLTSGGVSVGVAS